MCVCVCVFYLLFSVVWGAEFYDVALYVTVPTIFRTQTPMLPLLTDRHDAEAKHLFIGG